MTASEASLPEGWVWARMADVGSIRLGRQRSPSHESASNPTSYLRAGNIGDDQLQLTDVLQMEFSPAEQRLYALRAGDVVIAEGSGSPSHVGRSAIWRDELPLCCFQNTVIRFRPHAALPEYAHIVFRHYRASGRFAEAARGIGVLHLGATRLSAIHFPLPPLAEQGRIAAEYERRNSELAQARVALDSALANNVEQDHHVLRAAASGELIAAAVAERAPAAETESTNDDDSPQPLSNPLDTPNHWRWTTVGEAGELTLGKALSSKARVAGEMRPYLRVANIRENEIDLSDIKQMTFTDSERNRYTLRPQDILLTEASGSPDQLGRPAMFRGELPDAGYQNHLIRFRARPEVDPEFALLVFRHYLHAGEFRKYGRGTTTLANLSVSRLARMPFPLPPVDEQHAIAAEATLRLEASRAQREIIQASLDRTSHMADELLAAAATGELIEQDPADEPAGVLLTRIGAPPPDTQPSKEPTVEPAPVPSRPSQHSDAPETLAERILHALGQARAPLTLPELCRAARVDVNDVAEIEMFYIVIRAEIGKSIRIAGKSPENAQLEVLTHAS